MPEFAMTLKKVSLNAWFCYDVNKNSLLKYMILLWR